ncbi:MAG: heavy-metal-associated domain-containing protein [Flavobacteriia bacterium]|nr:heavy-metal-associated domain-containing protein [Flavobacteriia bacterium]
MKLQIVFFAGLLVLTACNSQESSKVTRKKSVNTSFKAVKVNTNRILTAEIEGMTCVMGCGASIRKELRATEAVSTVEFDFKEGRKSNTATIAFDKDKITVDKIINIISTINEKQFKVGKTSSKEFICEKSTEECKSKCEEKCEKACESEDSKIKISSNNIESPNFLNLITRFFVN